MQPHLSPVMFTIPSAVRDSPPDWQRYRCGAICSRGCQSHLANQRERRRGRTAAPCLIGHTELRGAHLHWPHDLITIIRSKFQFRAASRLLHKCAWLKTFYTKIQVVRKTKFFSRGRGIGGIRGRGTGGQARSVAGG